MAEDIPLKLSVGSSKMFDSDDGKQRSHCPNSVLSLDTQRQTEFHQSFEMVSRETMVLSWYMKTRPVSATSKQRFSKQGKMTKRLSKMQFDEVKHYLECYDTG